MLFDFASFIPRYFQLYFRCHVPECAIAHKNPPNVSVVGYKTLVQKGGTGGGYRRGVQEGGTGGGYRTREQEASTARFSAVCALVRCISALADVGVNAALGYWAVGFKSRLGRSELGKRQRAGGKTGWASTTLALGESKWPDLPRSGQQGNFGFRADGEHGERGSPHERGLVLLSLSTLGIGRTNPRSSRCHRTDRGWEHVPGRLSLGFGSSLSPND